MARFQFLAQFLSPEQIQYYKLDREGGATRVQLLMQGMQPTKEEFLKVAEAVDGLDTSLANGWFKPEVAEALRASLSPERFALLQDLRSPEYQAIFMVAGIYQFSPSTVNSLVSLRRNTYFQDPTGYLQQVKTLIAQPQAAARYLGDKLIHPVVTK